MLPDTQIAVQLTGPDRLELNRTKPVDRPGATQILGKVVCVGLCFSDMKLLHQFAAHPRKGEVVAGLDPAALAGIPSYVPGERPTVPGHEVVIDVVAAGDEVRTVEIGGRYLVQADWRDLKTAKSNGAFGYCFEGGLQQYVLLDERCTLAADGETSYLLPADPERGASATALVEPWGCIEDAFIHAERTDLSAGGVLLVARSPGAPVDLEGLDLERPRERLCLCEPGHCPPDFRQVVLDEVAEAGVDDICFAGADPDLLEAVLPKLGANGLVLIATGGQRFGREVEVPVGRVHYGNIRLAGYPGTACAKALARIPETGEVRPDDKVDVVGAAGPMGTMAVIRLVSQATPGVRVEAGDMAADRLDVLAHKAGPVAAATGVDLRCYNPGEEEPLGAPDYLMLMVPVGPLVAKAVADCNPGGLINIFAGIPADVSQDLDLDTYCEKGLYLIGTSGSTMEDMHAVLDKVNAGVLDTNLSVAAVSGMDGAIDGLEAVKNHTISGKILVYPDLGDFPLTTLEDLAAGQPAVGAAYDNGNWTRAAEAELLNCC